MTDLAYIAANCLMQKSRRAARQVTSIYEGAFAELDLTGGQFSILVAASLSNGATITLLAEELGMDRSTLSRALGPLERRALIEIAGSSQDSRARVVRVTKVGQGVLEEAIPMWERAQNHLEKAFRREELSALKSGLGTLSQT